MSLSRLALRLAAVDALCPSSAPLGPYPTIAGPRVWDSRKDAIDTLDDENAKPIILVYTEEDTASPYEGGTHHPDECFVQLVLELMVAAKSTVRYEIKGLDADGTEKTVFQDVGDLETQITDRQHEALLDVLEALVRRILDPRNSVPSADIFREVAMELRAIESVPLRDADETTRLAARTVRYSVKVKKEQWPAPSLTPIPLNGLDRLPAPLGAVARRLAPCSSGYQLCETLAAAMPDQIDLAVGPLFIDLFAAVDRVPTDTDADFHGKAP